ncbi:MAG: arsenate reductase ArsC [Gammaproteobacteria bacterium]
MSEKFNVLFLCTANAARSIMAEAILNHAAPARFVAYSAGSRPGGTVHPLALELLARFELPTAGLRSKSWDEFATPGAPRLDFVFTVCDRAAQEACPVWPGQPMTAHWGIADPVHDGGDELARLQRFRTAFAELERRIGLFVNLPFAALDTLRLQQALDDIGRR